MSTMHGGSERFTIDKTSSPLFPFKLCSRHSTETSSSGIISPRILDQEPLLCPVGRPGLLLLVTTVITIAWGPFRVSSSYTPSITSRKPNTTLTFCTIGESRYVVSPGVCLLLNVHRDGLVVVALILPRRYLVSDGAVRFVHACWRTANLVAPNTNVVEWNPFGSSATK